jgi:hypothetical protein
MLFSAALGTFVGTGPAKSVPMAVEVLFRPPSMRNPPSILSMLSRSEMTSLGRAANWAKARAPRRLVAITAGGQPRLDR